MKKAFLAFGVLTMFLAAEAQAVLCTVQTSDPRYYVASYVRNQTACKSTLLAEGATGLAAIGQMVVIFGAIKAFSDIILAQSNENTRRYLLNEMKEDSNAKVYSCTRKGTIQIITANGNAYADYDNLVLHEHWSGNVYEVTTSRGHMIFDSANLTLAVKDHRESEYRVGSCKFVSMLTK